MSTIKLLPRNVAAQRRAADPSRPVRLVPGNSVSTRLESGVGNCYPGLECDLRNLERRFFPFLEVDVLQVRELFDQLRVVSVDRAGVDAAAASGAIDAATAAAYHTVANNMPANPATPNAAWMIRTLEGTFGPLGPRKLTLPLSGDSFGADRDPTDAWTAVRLLTEDTAVEIQVVRGGMPPVTLRGHRARYLDDNGALADMFLPGELTQSLCSPWTHDFRDCACFYWASNHPDIVLPPDPPPNTTDVRWDLRVDWERRDRTPGRPPAPATASGPGEEMDHQEINLDWQKLNFVLEDREHTTPYRQKARVVTTPFPVGDLARQLRYAAGVEIAVMHAYLAAAFSLRDASDASGDLADDIAATHYEIMRVAVSEMRHIRGVRDVLIAMPGVLPPFDPPLRIATRVPGLTPDNPPMELPPSALTRDRVEVFIKIEGPNLAVDGLYNRILATLELTGNERSQEGIRRIMAEGEDHQKVFKAIREWLRPHDPGQYLRAVNLAPPPAGNAAHRALQASYRDVLELLHTGYKQTTVAGASNVNDARNSMIGPLFEAGEAVARENFLVTFDRITDPRFAPIDPPQ
jgi:Ferritin-like